ncbi:MAG TPA: hypothetical protein IAA08_07060 [Candidatus Eubacterium avistercoris]|uniref:Uncharacterized protein n=1 Tax=Candidatus Eubacterium avistercoris TaxID=2838567 RepID=A0A9D2IGG4_9FIRM|nr:hypothetical protein [Candidatus Eubacterium avistercoris]
MKKKAGWIVAGAILILGICVPGIKEGQVREKAQNVREGKVPVSSVEQFEGKLYDPGRQQPRDMTELIGQDQERRGFDRKKSGETISAKKLLERETEEAAWYVLTDAGGQSKIRYYETDTEYALGWRLLERNGERDWYFFEEDTGYLAVDTTVDGALLSKEGYAVAAAAGNVKTLETAGKTAHCGEIMLIEDIELEDTLDVEKEMTYLTASGSFCRISASEQWENIAEVMYVKEDAGFCMGQGVAVDTCGKALAAVAVGKNASFDCFGWAGNSSETEAGTGVLGLSDSSRIGIYEGAVITGNGSGIVNQGITKLAGGTIRTNGTQTKKNRTDKSVLPGDRITGNDGHGIRQTGGTLRMSGGMIIGNGRLGSNGEPGSYGGGVLLTGSASMYMSGGIIAANRAAAGGGIYVSAGCTLTVTGGRIGGKDKYYERAKNNTVANGNYARESRIPADQNKYRAGEGGGIYSLGTVVLNGKEQIQIGYNCAKGAGGGGGIHAAGGSLHISGKVSVSSNRALSSEAPSSSLLYGGGDANGEGGGIRIGQEHGTSAKCYINYNISGSESSGRGNVVIEKNSASGDGGGIFESSGSANELFVGENVCIQKNQSGIGGGGGVKSLGGYLSLKGAVIAENQAKDGNHGGGVLTAGKTEISDCRIFGNSASRAGGGICFYDSSVGTSGRGIISGTKVYENTAVTNGAGIMIGSSKGTVTAEETEVYENQGTEGGIRCQKGSVFQMKGGAVWGNSRYGISNGGNMVLSGNIRIGRKTDLPDTRPSQKGKIQAGGIYNTGELSANAREVSLTWEGDESGCGLYNNGGRAVWDGSISGNFRYGICNAGGGTVEIRDKGSVASCRWGIYNKKGAKLLLAGGRILECGVYGIYAESDSRLYMEGTFGADRKSVIFLEKGNLIHITGPLTGSLRPVAVLDTEKGKDRMPGRILVRTAISGKTGGDILEEGEKQTFELAYKTLDTGEEALLRGGEGISRKADLDITERDIILSACYQVAYDPGYSLFPQAEEGDIVLEQQDTRKYWMEDLVLDLRAPRFASQALAGKNWTFRYWEGSDHVIYSASKAIYRENKDLFLQACWERDKTCYLEGWLYSRSRWLREQMQGSKEEESYRHFLKGDTGILTFRCRNVETVRILWPDTGKADELKTYDRSGSQVKDRTYDILALTKDPDREFYCDSYQFQVPLNTPKGVYQVQILGRTTEGEQIAYPLTLYVEEGKITSRIRTRIR